MSKNSFNIAVAQIETVEDGKRVYIDPGQPVRGLDEKEVDKLLKIGAIRKPTEAEAKLEDMLQREADNAGTGKRRRAKADDDAGKTEDDGDKAGDDGI